MKFNEILVVILIILTILTIGAVSASDNITSGDLSIGLEDSDVQESSADDVIISIDETLDETNTDDDCVGVEDNNQVVSSEEEDAVGVEENNENALESEKIADSPVLTTQNTNDEVLTADNSIKFNVTFYKQTGKYADDKKIYFKVVDAKTGKPNKYLDELSFGVYKNKIKEFVDGSVLSAKVNSNGFGVFKWSDVEMYGDSLAGNFLIDSYDDTYIWDDDGNRFDVTITESIEKVSVFKRNVNIVAKSLTAAYKSDKKYTIKVLGSDKKPIANAEVKVKIYTGKKYTAVTLKTNSKGIATYKKVSKLSPGKHKIIIDIDKTMFSAKSVKSSIKINAINVVIKPNKLSTTYKSGKYFKAKITDSKTKKVVKGVKVNFKVYTGKKAKTVTLTSNSKGIIKYSSSKLDLGKHKVVLKVKKSDDYKGKSKTSSIEVSKAALKISAPAVHNIYKKAGKFQITVKNKASGKPVKGIKVVMKVYTGSKYKTYAVKTNSKGKASFSTKSLSKAKHKVIVTAKATSKYKKATKKSSVKITTKLSAKIILKHHSVRNYEDKYLIGLQPVPGTNTFREVYGSNGFKSYASFTPVLKDKNGHEIKGSYEAEMWVGGSHAIGEVIKGKFGEEKTYHSSSAFCEYKVVIKFAGNSKYKACQATLKI